MSFVHLHTHSHYSLLDGLSKVPELIDAAKSMGMPAIALTDHGNLYGAIEFYKTAQKNDIKPIIGVEAYLAPSGIDVREPKERPYHLVLLAKNTTGYENLVKLVSLSNLEGFYGKPRIDMKLLEEYSDGLIVLSGCLSGPLSRAIMNDDMDKARELASEFLRIFGKEHFYLEVQHHPNLADQQKVNAALLELHKEMDIELVATADSHYISREDAEAQDVMVCIQTKSLLADENRMTMRNEDLSLASPEEMAERFADYPRAVENTRKIAEMVHIDIELGQIQIPHYELPDGVTPDDALAQMCREGLAERYEEVTPQIQERLDYELDIIRKTGYSSYFLIVQDFINWAKDEGVAVGPGRGSAAGSLVAYLTGITDVDPISYKLLFERFLNPERISMPDIDTDFADVRRQDVLRYVEQKYGKDRVAQIITFGTMAARAALRDVGRALGLSYGYCDRVAKMIPMFTTLDEAIETVPELAELLVQDADAERLIAIAKKLEGCVRHTSTHACAVVITKDPLTTRVPLQVDQEGATITQYSMNPIEDLGLLKMDFLGLKNLTIIESTLEIIEATTGEKLDIEAIPLTDKQTFSLLKKAQTIGVFQLESSGMRRYLKKLKPTEIEDIIAMVALYRPGPMEFIPDYIDGKHGKREITYLDNRLEPILGRTYGIALYQEQIMEIARELAGYTYGEADVLRKAVGKKIKELLDEQEQKMLDGMEKNGFQRTIAKQIWEFILPFARYGFNRSHAACYAMIAYRTAYLKANYPAQFMAALLTSDHGNSERVALEIAHAEEMGMKVLPPSINESFGTFAVVKETLDDEQPLLRFGLNAIKNLGDNIVNVVIKERKANGPYISLEDFLSRVNDKDLNKKSLEALIKSGALDDFGTRSQLLANMETLIQFAKRAQTEANTGQSNLFAGLSEAQQPSMTLSPAPDVDERTVLDWEKEFLGLYISGHPLGKYKKVLATHSIPFAELHEHKREVVTVIGMITSVKKIITKKGEPMAFVGFADYTSEIEVLVFPSSYADTTHYWNENDIVQISGKVDAKDGSIKILLEEVKKIDIDAMSEQVDADVEILLPEKMKKSLFAQLEDLLSEHAGEEHRVFLSVNGKRIDTKKHITPAFIDSAKELLGHEAVRMIHSD